MKELISIIIPVYNVEQHIQRCIKSIINQTYTCFELILVDDGSTDLSFEICKRFSDQDERIKVIRKKNGGASSARNCGLNNAKGKYIVFIDADDFVSTNYLHNLYEATKLGDYDIVQCDYEIVKSSNSINNQLFSNQDLYDVDKVNALNNRKYNVCVWGKIYSSNLFKNYRFRENIIYEDDDSYYVLIDEAKKLGILKEKLYYYFLSNNSVMRNEKHYKNTDFINVYKRRINYFRKKKNYELLHGSYERFCIVLMLVYTSCINDKLNENNKNEFIALFERYYKKIQLKKVSNKRDAALLFCFHISHYFTSKVLYVLKDKKYKEAK